MSPSATCNSSATSARSERTLQGHRRAAFALRDNARSTGAAALSSTPDVAILNQCETGKKLSVMQQQADVQFTQSNPPAEMQSGSSAQHSATARSTAEVCKLTPSATSRSTSATLEQFARSDARKQPPFSAPCARTPAPPPLPPSPLPCTLPASVAVSRARCSREPASACAVSAVPASRVAATPAFRASNSPTADCAQRAVRCHWRGGGLRHQNVVRRRRGSGRDGRAAGLGEKRVEQGGVRSIRKSVRATLLVPSAGRAGATRVRRKGRAAGGSRAGAGRSPLQVP